MFPFFSPENCGFVPIFGFDPLSLFRACVQKVWASIVNIPIGRDLTPPLPLIVDLTRGDQHARGVDRRKDALKVKRYLAHVRAGFQRARS